MSIGPQGSNRAMETVGQQADWRKSVLPEFSRFLIRNKTLATNTTSQHPVLSCWADDPHRSQIQLRTMSCTGRCWGGRTSGRRFSLCPDPSDQRPDGLPKANLRRSSDQQQDLKTADCNADQTSSGGTR